MNVVEVISSTLKEGRRLVKFLRFGKSDVKENYEASPFGLDSNPVKKTVALYTTTSSNGQSAVIGYVQTGRKAAAGEFRTYATDADGAEVFYTWIKNDGTYEIGGDADNAVRYSKLEDAFNELKADFNALVTDYNAHIHATTATISATPTVGVISPTTSQGSPSTADITPAKVDEVKIL